LDQQKQANASSSRKRGGRRRIRSMQMSAVFFFSEIVHCLRQVIFRVGQWTQGAGIYFFKHVHEKYMWKLPFHSGE